jgi:regulatory protein
MKTAAEKLTPNQALQKLKHYCAYQDRCHSEVKEKLYSYGLFSTDVDACISTLIEENYLNEERFAIQFAGGKFRMKKWGRVKIKYELKRKQISDYCIKKALSTIDDEVYLQNLQTDFEKKISTLKSEKNIFTKKRKIKDYLQQKGYELDLITDLLKTV